MLTIASTAANCGQQRVPSMHANTVTFVDTVLAASAAELLRFINSPSPTLGFPVTFAANPAWSVLATHQGHAMRMTQFQDAKHGLAAAVNFFAANPGFTGSVDGVAVVCEDEWYERSALGEVGGGHSDPMNAPRPAMQSRLSLENACAPQRCLSLSRRRRTRACRARAPWRAGYDRRTRYGRAVHRREVSHLWTETVVRRGGYGLQSTDGI